MTTVRRRLLLHAAALPDGLIQVAVNLKQLHTGIVNLYWLLHVVSTFTG